MGTDDRWTDTVRAQVDPGADPSPPSSIPKYIVEGLQKQGAETLREIARFSLQLALSLEAQAQRELEQSATGADLEEPPEDWNQDDEQWEQTVSEVRDEKGVPQKAYRTIKTIDGRDYVYAQWRDGDTVKSEYICPVAPADPDS